jgi:type II secretory pathway component PulF
MHATLLLIAQAVKSGVPLATAIRLTVGDQPDRTHAALLRLAELLDKGLEPKVAAAQSGLPKQQVELLDVALTSNDFAGTFEELAKLELRRSLTIHRLVQIFAYPVILLVSCILILGGFLVITVPPLVALYEDFYVELPIMTAWIFQLSHMVQSPLSLLGLGAFAVTLYVAVKFLFPRFWFCVPVFGHLGRNLYTAKMLRQMATLVSQQVPLPEALEQCGKSMRNSAYRRDCRSAATAARNGMSFAEIVLRYYWLFPAWLSPVVAADSVRQDSSPQSLPKSLRRAADTVEQQQDTSLLALQTVCLPLFILVIVVGMGFFSTALFMPLVALITELSGRGSSEPGF